MPWRPSAKREVANFTSPRCHLDADLESGIMQNLLNDTRSCILITHNPSIADLGDQTIHLD